MDFIRTLLIRDFARKSRQRFFHTGRVLTVLFLSLFLAFGYLQSLFMSDAVGLRLFNSMVPLVVLLAAFGAPLSAAQQLVQERQSRALDLLMVSDISLAHLLAGRYASSVLISLLGLLCAMPLLMLCASLGGIGIWQIVLALIVLFSTICFGTSLGMLSGSLARSRRSAVTGALLLAIAAYVVLPLFNQALDGSRCLSPFAAMGLISRGVELAGVRDYVIYSLLASLALAALAAGLMARRHGGESINLLSRPKVRHHLDRPPIGLLNPVAWHELHCRLGGRRGYWQRWLGWQRLSVLCLLIAAVALHEEVAMVVSGWVFFAGGLLMFIYLLSSFWQSCNAFESERESGIMELIVSTDLTGQEIIAGKLQAIRKYHSTLLTLLVFSLVLNLAIGLLLGFFGDTWSVLIGVSVFAIFLLAAVTGVWYGLTGIGIYAGYRFPSHPVLVALGLLMLLNVPLTFFGWIAFFLLLALTAVIMMLLESIGLGGELLEFLMVGIFPITAAMTIVAIGFIVGALGRHLAVFRLHRLQRLT